MKNLFLSLMVTATFAANAQSGAMALNTDTKKTDYEMAEKTDCMPEAQMQDAELEAAILKAYKEKAKNDLAYYKTDDARKVSITASDWTIIRDESTGLIKKRGIAAAIGCVNNGKCYWVEILFTQAWDGTGYQKSVRCENGNKRIKIDCSCFEKN